jgi:transposase
VISSDIEAEIERLWKVQGIHTPGTIARLASVHRDVAVRVLTTAGLLPPKDALSKASTPRPSILDEFLPLIDDTLQKYPGICASRLFSMLKERGYPGVSSSHVRDVVGRRRPVDVKEAFLKLAMLPGEQAQVDWAHFGPAGENYPKRTLYAFAMTLAYSRKIFLRFFLSMRMREFQQGFVEGFEFFGGVPRQVLIDNLKSGVAERVAHIVRFNDDFTRLARHYAFETLAANVRKGNE